MVKQACLDPETIAALAEGVLPFSERKPAERHLASCDDCCEALAATVLYLNETKRKVLPWRWLPQVAAVLLVAFIGGVLVTQDRCRRGPVNPLVAVASAGRSSDARLSGLPWGPLAQVERSAADQKDRPDHVALAATVEVERQAKESPTVENRRRLGAAHVLMGELDEAVAVLRSVAEEAPAKAGPWNDLAAALLARGEAKNRTEDLLEALSFIDRALAADSTLREALFNKAVALEKLHLDEQAQEAWRRYLERGTEPGWSEEAGKRLEKLQKGAKSSQWEPDRERIEAALARGDTSTTHEIVSRRTQETRAWILHELLVSWALAESDGRVEDADRVRMTARALAAALLEATGDRMTGDAVAAVGSTPRPPTLVRGLLIYGRGVESSDRFDMKQAKPYFEEAEGALDQAGNPLALWASLEVARCQNYEGEGRGGLPRLERLLAEAERKGYLALLAEASWLRGLLESKSSRLGDSLADYQRALRLFEQIHEDENAGFLSALLAEDLGFLGDEPAAAKRIMEALSRLPRVRAVSHRIGILMHAAIVAERMELPDAALSFENAAVETASARGDDTDRADSLKRRAAIMAELGRLESAGEDLARARSWAARLANADERARVEAELLAADGHVARLAGDPARAVAVLSEAIGYFAKTEFDVRLPELHLERARASRARADPSGAERDLRAGIELLERHRADVLQDTQRVSYFDTSRGLFEEIVGLEISRGRSDAALRFLERGKTRDLLDRWHSAPQVDVEELSRLIPSQVAVIAYGILPDRLLVWAIANGTREVKEESIRSEDLKRLVRRFRAQLESADDPGASETAQELYDLLVFPVLERIAGVATWVFVPDQVLHAVPFAALADRRTHRFVVEDHPVLVVPSIALFLHATRGRPPASGSPRSVLAVGDPAFDEDAFPDLRRLPGAAAEATHVADLYPDSVTLTGPLATPAAFLEEIGRHDVLHLAGHALANDADLSRSRLVLAVDPDRHDSGSLFADKLYQRSFGRMSLVVLAACATASGRISSGEGPLSLARPFLAGGVPTVVATLWEIEDASSAELVIRLHRDIVGGIAPEEALRRAQVAMIEGTDPALRAPRAWAAFQVVGGARAARRG